MEEKLTLETRVDFETLTEREKQVFAAGEKKGRYEAVTTCQLIVLSMAFVVIFVTGLHGYVRHDNIWHHF